MDRHWHALAIILALGFTANTVRAQEAAPVPPPGAYREMGSSRFLNFGRVFAVSFSPNGKTLAATCWDGTLWLGDLATGKVRHQWEKSGGWGHVHAFSPDGKTLAAVGPGQVVRLWDVASGEMLREFAGHKGELRWIAFSADGRFLGSQCPNMIRLRKTPSFDEVRTIDKFFGYCAPALSADGELLAYAPDRQSIILADPVSGKEIRKLDVLPLGGGALDFSPDGEFLFFRPDYGAIRLWLTRTGKILPAIGAERLGRAHVTFAPDGRTLALAPGDSTIQIIELASRLVRFRIKSMEMAESCVAFSPDGRTLATGSVDRAVLLWDLTGRREKDSIPAVPLAADELQKLWEDLEADSGERAHQAIWKLVAGAKDSVPFLGRQIAAVKSADAEIVARLVRELDAAQFAVRNRAFAELQKLREGAEAYLQARLTEKIPLETRRRIEQLIDRNEDHWTRQWRLLRALEVLEAIATPEAQQALGQLAAGDPGARLTRQAQASLLRLKKVSGH